MSRERRGKSRSKSRVIEPLPTPSLVRVVATFAIALALCWIAATQALGMVSSRFNPDVAMQVASNNGLAYGRSAELLLARSATDDPTTIDPAVLEQAKALGIEGFKRAPLSIPSIRSAAIATDFGGDNASARAAMADLNSLTKRDRSTHLWMISDLGKQGDLDGVLRHYNMALRSSRQAQTMLLPQLAAGLQFEEFVGPLSRVLSTRPPWTSRFWRAVYFTPSALPNAVDLRLALLNSGGELDSEVDRRLILSLVRERQWGLAERLYSAIVPEGADRVQAITSTELRTEPRFQPFDWTFSSTGLQSAAIDEQAGMMMISGDPASSQAAATRLVALSGGTYELAVNFTDANPDETARLTARVRCVETIPNIEVATLYSFEGALRGSFRVDGSCRYHFVQLFLGADPDARYTQDIRITDLSLSAI